MGSRSDDVRKKRNVNYDLRTEVECYDHDERSTIKTDVIIRKSNLETCYENFRDKVR